MGSSLFIMVILFDFIRGGGKETPSGLMSISIGPYE
jgi:hypothetical protein